MNLSNQTLILLTSITPDQKYTNLEKIISNGDKFKHPIITNNIVHNKDVDPSKLLEFANFSYPILPEKVIKLIEDFLLFKRNNGTIKERKIYNQINIIDFIQRLISNRPQSFFGVSDKFVLRNGYHGNGWHNIGEDNELSHLSIIDYLTYDEIKISAFLQVSSPIAPINNGHRGNRGKKDINHIDEAIYVGAVGSRFAKPNRMEYQEIIISKKQNQLENGYGPLDKRVRLNTLDVFTEFYGLKYFPLFSEIFENNFTEHKKYPHIKVKSSEQLMFNSDVYERRMEITIETFLIEANYRGKCRSKKVYVHVVGLGLGVWMLDPGIQNKIYLDCFRNILNKTSFPYISDIDFSWVEPDDIWKKISKLKDFSGTEVTINFTRNDPFENSVRKKDKLVVAIYAWDGNSFPGNEYWYGYLSGSGDSAAACSSQIAEFQNAHINKNNINAKNLHIASPQYGLLHVSVWADKYLKKSIL